ncbi:MAG: DUF1993 family protein [Sphingobium sp.]
MGISLYDATVATWLQIIKAARAIIVKAQDHCAENGVDEKELLASRLAPDMFALNWQIKAMSRHSRFALEGVRAGSFSPDPDPAAESFAELLDQIDETIAFLNAVTPEEMDALIGQDMAFIAGPRRLEFTAENFLLSFSLPNFFFHATTAYDLLRQAGLPIGKLDFIGERRLKTPAAA